MTAVERGGIQFALAPRHLQNVVWEIILTSIRDELHSGVTAKNEHSISKHLQTNVAGTARGHQPRHPTHDAQATRCASPNRADRGCSSEGIAATGSSASLDLGRPSWMTQRRRSGAWWRTTVEATAGTVSIGEHPAWFSIRHAVSVPSRAPRQLNSLKWKVFDGASGHVTHGVFIHHRSCECLLRAASPDRHRPWQRTAAL